MGLQDRDYYRDEMKKRRVQGVFDTSRSAYSQKQFPGSFLPANVGSGWLSVLVRTLVICLAVYGALALIRDYRAGLKPWTKLDPERVERLLPYLSGK